MQGYQVFEPQKDSLFGILSLELNNNLLEEDANQLMVPFQIYQCVCDHTFISVGKNPVEGVGVVGGKGLA